MRMTDGDRQRIGRVRGDAYIQLQQTLHHVGDLMLGSGTKADRREFDGAWRIFTDR